MSFYPQDFGAAAGELDRYREMSIDEQQFHREEIIAMFKKLWACNPSEGEFSRHTSRLVVFPEIFYHMATHPLKRE